MTREVVPVPVFVNEILNVQSWERTESGVLGKTAVRIYSQEQVVPDVEVPGIGKAVLASTERYVDARVADAPAEVYRVNMYSGGLCLPREAHNHME